MSRIQDESTALDTDDRVGFDPITQTYHTRHDGESPDPLYMTVIKAVSVVTGREPEAMEPLYSHLEPDAFEALMSTAQDGIVHLSFSFEGCTIVVSSSGEVAVEREE